MDTKEYQRQYRIKNKKKIEEGRKRWYQKNRERVYANNRRSVEKNRDKVNENARRRYWNFKINILEHYCDDGGPKCECCGETQLEFLTLDHIDGNGGQHRREIKKKGKSFYQWIKKENYPGGFRILCMNCNASLGWFGYCPHGNIKKGVKEFGTDEWPLFHQCGVNQ
jgi:hypothetical protein